jgi:predicted transcriptional regulator
MIDEVQDLGFLSRVAAFIQQDQDASGWKEVLTARAARSEADFKAGRVFTQEEVEARFKARRTSR